MNAEPIRIIDQAHPVGFRPAMDYLIDKRKTQFQQVDQFQALVEQVKQIKHRALTKLPELLEQAEKNLIANGVVVHWAETCEQAQKIIHGIIEHEQADLLVKGKSMVSEEIHLNHYLEQRNIDAMETDMGEFIVQLAGEAPSHIIMPAIHKTKEDIANLFAGKLDVPYTDDVDELIAIGRQQMRSAFEKAKVGLSGVNFLAADTGTLCLVENEGNGRMSTTVPEVHIAITGIEKIVEHLKDVPTLIRALTRSATGQEITTYVNMINGPRKQGERDGPRQVHLVLLDNGRSTLFQKQTQQISLSCIRCGACMNHCPVYTRIGGLAYNTTYPGPIGKILSPHLDSLGSTPDHSKASALCGACNQVCPAGIPITALLLDQREKTAHPKLFERVGFSGWSWAGRHSTVYNAGVSLVLWGYGIWHRRLKWPVPLGGWAKHRNPPELSSKSLHSRMAKRSSKVKPQE